MPVNIDNPLDKNLRIISSVERIVKERNLKREERKRRKAEKRALKQAIDKMDEIPF